MKNQKFQLVTSDHPALRAVAEAVEPADRMVLKDQLYWLQKLRKKLKGAGLAAPQLGDSRRWFVWERGLVVNPTILQHGYELHEEQEGCLSFPGLKVWIKRPKRCRVTYLDENGDVVTLDLDGHESTIFQHEVDHLDGKCIDEYGLEDNPHRGYK